jgi:hypothetical protein
MEDKTGYHNLNNVLKAVVSWSYGSWIYNSLDNHYLSPLQLWVKITLRRVYVKQHYVIKFVSDLLHVGSFLQLRRYPVSSTNKTDHHDITEILLKMALKTP